MQRFSRIALIVILAVLITSCAFSRAGKKGESHGSLPIAFVRIEPGSFLMGSPPDDPDRDVDETQRWVTISKPFLLGATEVTQGQWRAVMGSNPSWFSKCGDNCPVEKVTWNRAADFCNTLSDREGLTRCYNGTGHHVKWDHSCTGYRLPTEAEWEYAARAGTTTLYPCGDSPDCLDQTAWCYENYKIKTRPVGKKKPNAWGLYDMLGNVWEWTWDWYDRNYTTDPVTDPVGRDFHALRTCRGGCFVSTAELLRSAERTSSSPTYNNITQGFRVARSLP